MFIQYNENPRDNFRAGVCVVRAISVATGDPWEKIYVEKNKTSGAIPLALDGG